MPPLTRRAILRAATPLASAAAAGTPTVTEWAATSPLRVMTRNLGLGAGLFSVLRADAIDPEGVYGKFDEVTDSGVSSRMRAVAEEVARERPAVVGVQEAATVRRGPAGGEATTTVVDFLGELRSALRALDAPYRIASRVTNADVSLPAAPSVGAPFTVRLTDSDALLVRADVSVREATAHNFRANVTASVSDRRITATRGYCLAELSVDGVPVTAVSTHLAAASRLVRRLQVGELLRALDGRDTAVAVLGDFNSGSVHGDGSAYDSLVAEFTDAWTVADGDGATCCQVPTLRNDRSRLAYRFDGVLVRGPVEPLAARLTGHTPDARVTVDDRTLWPSDHAGVVADLRVAPPLSDPVALVRSLL